MITDLILVLWLVLAVAGCIWFAKHGGWNGDRGDDGCS